MEELIGWLIGAAIVIGIIVAVIYMAALAAGYSLAYVGMTIIIVIEYFAHAFTWIGISDPSWGWFLLGLLAGGIFGLKEGLKRAGRHGDTPKVYAGAVISGLLLLLTSWLAVNRL